MKLHVIRHGQTATNAAKGMVGRKQVYRLTETGEEQARQARSLTDQLDYDIVISSPLLRAKVTCEIVISRTSPFWRTTASRNGIAA